MWLTFLSSNNKQKKSGYEKRRLFTEVIANILQIQKPDQINTSLVYKTKYLRTNESLKKIYSYREIH